jgi:SAM-dependent methyltransferase
LDDASADLVVSFETLEHISDATRFLRECRRILTPNGIFICSTPNRMVNRWMGPNRFHLREVRPDEFAAMLRELFVDIQLYSQSEVTYLTFVFKRSLIELLRLAGVKELVRKVFEPSASIITRETRFKEIADREYELRPYLPSRLRRPTYVISVSRKAE